MGFWKSLMSDSTMWDTYPTQAVGEPQPTSVAVSWKEQAAANAREIEAVARKAAEEQIANNWLNLVAAIEERVALGHMSLRVNIQDSYEAAFRTEQGREHLLSQGLKWELSGLRSSPSHVYTIRWD